MAALRELTARYPLLAAVFPPERLSEQLSGLAQNAGLAAAGLFPVVFDTLHVLINFVSVLVMGIYMALRPEVYREGIVSLAPPVHRELVRDILADLARSLRAWIGGQMLAMIFLGVLTWIGLEILRRAVRAGVRRVHGRGGDRAVLRQSGVHAAPRAVRAGQPGGRRTRWLVVLLGVIIHIIEANFVHPLIMERRVHLPPVLSILSVLIMAELLGLVGLLVAVPVLATLMVITRRIYVHRLLEGKGFRRFVRDAPSEVRLPDGVLRTVPAGAEHPRDAGAGRRGTAVKKYQVRSAECQVPSTRRQRTGTWHPAPGTWHSNLGTILP